MEDIKIRSDDILCEWIVEAKCKATKDQLCACLIKFKNNLNKNRKIGIKEHENHTIYSGVCGRANSALGILLGSHDITEDNNKEIRESNKEIIKQTIKEFIQKTNPDPYSFPTHTYRNKDIGKYIIEFTTRGVKNTDIDDFKK